MTASFGVFFLRGLGPWVKVAFPSWRCALLCTGMYGVPFFFALSAFLVTRLLQMGKARTGRVELKAYCVRRTLRIWPLYPLVVASVPLFLRAPARRSWTLPSTW